MKDNATDNSDILVSNEGPCVDILLAEWKQAGVMPNGFYDVAFNQETRRMIWAGQSPDGRKWDENMPEGEEARPWNGASDTRVPMVDGIINDDVAVGCVAFQRAELRATAVDPDQAELAAEVSKHLHWMVHTRYSRMLALEVELSLQYSREHGFCIAYVGWEREVSKRRVRVRLEDLANAPNQYGPANPTMPLQDEGKAAEDSRTPNPGGLPAPSLIELVMDPEQEEAAVVMVQELYRQYVTQALAGQAFDDELQDSRIVEMSASGARKAVVQLREEGEADIPMAYVCKNQPIVWVGQPFLEMLAARGTMELQKAPVMFWRRWMNEADLKAKAASGWDKDWIAAVLKTKGNISSWAGALGATSLTGPSTKTVGSTTYLKITEENNPLMEVIYAHVKKVDEDGVTGVWETIFSPHLPGGGNAAEDGGGGRPDSGFCAKHELLDYAHGRYPYLELKRENIGRALVDTRSVSEIAATWQNEQKAQKDMLFNRSEMDTLPPVSVPKLGGVGYRLGPGAQVPMNRNQKLEKALELGPLSPLAMELIQQSRLEAKEYFGRPDAQLDPSITAAKQAKMGNDLYRFWGDVLAMMFALTVQYNPGEVDRVCNHPGLAESLDVFTVLDQMAFGLEFDIAELNPDYVVKKMGVLNDMVLPGDAAGIIDRAKLTAKQVRMVDPRLAQELIQDQSSAAQKIYDDVDAQVARMALGNEAKYVENDPSASMRLQYLQTVVQNNPKYQLWLGLPGQGSYPDGAKGQGGDPRFKALMANYAKNLQMSVEQQQNKVVGRIGVKQIGAGA